MLKALQRSPDVGWYGDIDAGSIVVLVESQIAVVVA